MNAVEALEANGIMNPRRLATVAALCGTGVLAGWLVGWQAGLGEAGIESAGTLPTQHGRPPLLVPSLAADIAFANAPRAAATNNVAAGNGVVEAAVVEVGVVEATVDQAEIDK